MTEIAKQTCIEMIQQRGYTNIEHENEYMIKAFNVETNDNVIIFIDSSIKLNKDTLTKYMSVMKSADVNHGILIYNEGVTSVTVKYIEQTIDMVLEIFPVRDLQFNITKHRLQPCKFRRLTTEEMIVFKEKYTLKFPIMRYSDPIRRFFNFRRGDIIEVTNKNTSITHRVVK